MGTRLELQTILEQVLGSKHVYFQPPASIRMTYPSIVYELDGIDSQKADDKTYVRHRRYAVKYISRDPDNTVVDDLLSLQYSSFDRRYVADGLYHDCVSLYF